MGIDRNNISARLENPLYGSHSLKSLKKVAKANDVGLVVWFVPFSRMVDWATGTPYEDEGLTAAFYDIPDFDHDQLRPIRRDRRIGEAANPNPPPPQRLNQLSESYDASEEPGNDISSLNPQVKSKPPLNNGMASMPATP
jgi:hypothetical protein